MSDNQKFMTSARWNINKVKPVRQEDSVSRLFSEGMGVDSKKRLNCSYSQPKLVS
jgi:hypothetical protein